MRRLQVVTRGRTALTRSSVDLGSSGRREDPFEIIRGGDGPQSNVSAFVRRVADRWGCSHIVDLECDRSRGPAARCRIVQLEPANALERCGAVLRIGEWIERDLHSGAPLVPREVLREVLPNALVLARFAGCHDEWDPLLEGLHRIMDHAPAAFVTTRTGCTSALERSTLRIDFAGGPGGPDEERAPSETLTILANNHAPRLTGAPSGFRVVALMPVYNEEDIIVPSLTRLIDQGVEVYLIDNWSTDRTVERAHPFLGHGVINIERFPPAAPPSTFDWARLLNRIEEVTTEVEADWYLQAEADGFRSSPWPEVSLRDAIYHVDRLGFNAIDHTLLQFRPVDNGYVDGANPEHYFRFFDFDYVPDNQIKTWKNTGMRVYLAGGGHQVTFAGRQTYPYNFLYKHYPVRSQRHGERKVLAERLARYNPDERLLGWHSHYDEWIDGRHFLWSTSDLFRFDEGFYSRYLIERLGSVDPGERSPCVPPRRRHRMLRSLAGRARRGLRRH